jgi:acetylornithine deacetylase/succinyl-diaminopimelate desuccinylase-like protein
MIGDNTAVVPLLQELIRNRCVNDGTRASGDEYRSVGTLAEFFGEPGVVVEPVPGRQSVVYRVPGENPEAATLLLLPHLDVVPVNLSGWSVDPFAAEISDGFVWGRGAVDMLNVTSAMAVIFKKYLTGEKPPLPGDLIFAAVADEEAAGGLGARYLVDERYDLVEAGYVLTEVAYPAIPTPSGPLHPVVAGEKGPMWSKLRSTGTPGHGSGPYQADNALEPMVAALAGLFATPAPVAITDQWRRFVGALELEADLAERLTDPDRVDDAIDEVAVTDPLLARYFHSATHLTVSPNTLQAGVKANIIPDQAEAEIDLRALPGMDRAFVDSHLRKAMGRDSDRIEIIPLSDYPATMSATTDPLWEAIEESLWEETSVRRAVPVLMPGATDARFFRTKGAIAYGVGLFDDRVSFSEFLSLFHGHDERVSVRSVERTTDLIERVVAHFGERSVAGPG